MKVQTLQQKLSLKLGDPVEGNDDGAIFDLDMRVAYIQRGYSRLIRVLKSIMLNYAPQFASQFKIVTQDLDNDGSSIALKIDDNEPIITSISELYIKSTETDNYVQCTYIKYDKYLTTKFVVGDVYKPDIKKDDIFYTIIQNKICMLPILSSNKKYISLYAMVEVEVDKITIDSNLLIDNTFEDLLIVMAASEGMQDLGRQDKVGIYNQDIVNQLNILKSYAEILKTKEGSNVNA